jgi:hypothetical protein
VVQPKPLNKLRTWIDQRHRYIVKLREPVRGHYAGVATADHDDMGRPMSPNV